ncbi:MAG: MATE family efflux transporter [Bacillota bacterium]
MKQMVSLKKEKIYQDLWRLSWPVMMFMVFQTSLELVDFFWVGMMGTEALAALSLSHNIFWMLFTLSQLITVSTLSLSSRYRGGGDYEGVKLVARHTFWLAVILSVLVVTFIFSLGDYILSLYQVEPEVHRQALIYLRVAGTSFLFLYGGIGLAFCLQGVGDSYTSMGILIFTNIINIVLDPFLIFGLAGLPELGILGAALASLIARAAGFALILYVVLSGKISPSRLKVPNLFSLRLSADMFKRMLRIGFPASLQGMTRPLTGAIMMWVVALFGTEAVAAFGIGLRLLSFCFILIAGLNMGTATMVGQSLGARLRDLTEEVIARAMRLALTIQAIMGVIAFFAAPTIMSAFADNPQVIEMGIAYIRLLVPALIAMGPLHVIAATFKGAGNTVPHMISALIANWLVKIPLAMLLAIVFDLETDGVWLAIGLSIFAELGIISIWYRRRDWIYRDSGIYRRAEARVRA